MVSRRCGRRWSWWTIVKGKNEWLRCGLPEGHPGEHVAVYARELDGTHPTLAEPLQ